MTDWHVDDTTMARYASGAVPLSVGASVEAHLLSCPRCRAGLASAVPRDRLSRLWEGIEERVDAPRAGLLERLLNRLGVAEDTARLLAATPALRWSWSLAILAAVAFAAIGSDLPARGSLLYLTVAPILPVIGVAAAFHWALDPTYEVGLASPYPPLKLLLVRTAAVTGVTCAALVGAGLFLPDPALTAAAWLLPALALTSLTLGLARRMNVVYAAASVGALWLLLVVSARATVFGPVAQLAWLLVAVVSLTWLVADRHRLANRLGGVW